MRTRYLLTLFIKLLAVAIVIPFFLITGATYALIDFESIRSFSIVDNPDDSLALNQLVIEGQWIPDEYTYTTDRDGRVNLYTVKREGDWSAATQSFQEMYPDAKKSDKQGVYFKEDFYDQLISGNPNISTGLDLISVLERTFLDTIEQDALPKTLIHGIEKGDEDGIYYEYRSALSYDLFDESGEELILRNIRDHVIPDLRNLQSLTQSNTAFRWFMETEFSARLLYLYARML